MGRRYDYEWNYYSENRPRKVAGGIKARSDRGAIGETWWSRRWVNVLESLGMGTRLTRGRSYARQGQVLSIDIETGLVKAKVQGSMEKPYSIKIRLHPLSDQDWEQVTDAMSSQAIFAAKLLAGEMPPNIEEAFQVVTSLPFPNDAGRPADRVAPVPTGPIPANTSPPSTTFWLNVLMKTPF